MIVNDRFDHDLAAWLDAETSLSVPVELHAGAMDRARRTTQRPAWVVSLRGGTFAAPGLAVTNRRTLSLLVVLGLLVVAGLAVIVLGAPRTKPQPLGANGLIVYSYQGRNHGPGGTLLVGPDGSGGRPSPVNGCVQFSQDGRLFLVAVDDGPRMAVRVVDAVTGAEELVPTPGLDTTWHPHSGSFALSPDGTRVAWLKDLDPASEGPHRQELWISAVQGGSAWRVVAAPVGRVERFGIPAWSPDGRSLAFTSFLIDPASGSPTDSAIRVIDPQTGEGNEVSTRSGPADAVLAWSPDSRSIVFAAMPDGAALPSAVDRGATPPSPPSDLFVIGVDGTGERNLTGTAASEHRPAWAPGGAWLGYLTSAGDDEEAVLATLAMDGTSPVGAPTFGPPAEFVIWSPDGAQLLIVGLAAVGAGDGPMIGSIDRAMTSVTRIAEVEGTVICPPSWQRLDP